MSHRFGRTRSLLLRTLALGACALLAASSGRADQSPPAYSSGPAGALSALVPAPATSATSDNWSGYLVACSPCTAVKGTFTVPSVQHYVAGATVSEWVGIDGWADNSLIQAGVNEIPEAPGETLLEPWWEVLPGPQQLAPGVMVSGGDSVTVSIRQVNPDRWRISLTDCTNSDNFTTTRPYSGPSSSAEWIVEADLQASGAPTTLAPYAPEVPFTDLSVGGQPTTLSRVVMVQHARDVSTPSALGVGTFAVAYGTTAPAVPLLRQPAGNVTAQVSQ